MLDRCHVERRWRKLEGSDPTTYEMILKIQMLQKRLIAKTEEVVEKDLLIQARRAHEWGWGLSACCLPLPTLGRSATRAACVP